jgi:hypothetical protein
MFRTACAWLFCLMAGAAGAADYRAGPNDYRAYLNRLQAGDRLLLEPGDYRRGLPLHNLSGLPGKPIVIEASNPAEPPRFVARPGANTVSLVNVRHVALRHLQLDGGNVPVDAIKAEGHSRYADFVTLENLHIHDHAASQQNVGISTKCPAFGWVVRGNRIERVGTGMYFGDSDGSDPFVGGLIEENRVSDTLGYNLQIKHQKTRPAEYVGRHDTVIRYNLFSKAGAQPGPQARPNVLLGHFPLAEAGSEDRYLVHGNLFLHNPSEALFQAEGRVALYDNMFITGSGDAIRIQPHNDVPRDMMIFSNTVLASGAGIAGAAGRRRCIPSARARQCRVGRQSIIGGEAGTQSLLSYRPDLLDTAVTDMTPRLIAGNLASAGLPESLVRELASYPDWRGASRPGASIAPELLRTMGASRP